MFLFPFAFELHSLLDQVIAQHQNHTRTHGVIITEVAMEVPPTTYWQDTCPEILPNGEVSAAFQHNNLQVAILFPPSQIFCKPPPKFNRNSTIIEGQNITHLLKWIHQTEQWFS